MIIFIVNTTIIFFVNIMILTINNIMTTLVILISSGWSVRRGARGDRTKGSADARQSSPRGHSTGQGDPPLLITFYHMKPGIYKECDKIVGHIQHFDSVFFLANNNDYNDYVVFAIVVSGLPEHCTIFNFRPPPPSVLRPLSHALHINFS